MVKEVSIKRILIGRLSEGSDLLNSIRDIVRKYNIKGGWVNLIGSLKKVNIGYYDREHGKYISKESKGFYELVSCIGNISWKDDEPIVHIHMAVSSKDGDNLLGHVLEGNIVDATVEYMIIEFNEMVQRVYDESTRLNQLDV